MAVASLRRHEIVLAYIATLQLLLTTRVKAVVLRTDTFVSPAQRLSGSSVARTDSEASHAQHRPLNLAHSGQIIPHPIKLQNHLGVQYLGPISFGEQDFSAIYDTGSFETIVLSMRCGTCGNETPRYDSEESNTFEPLDDKSMVHVFGSGPVLARRSAETITFGDASSPYVVEHMPFWQVERHNLNVWKNEDGAKFSAIVGLGPRAKVPDSNVDTLLERLDVDSFGYCLEEADRAPGWITLQPSLSALPQQPTRVPVIGDIHWATQLTEVSFTSEPGIVVCEDKCGAIVDTGTSMIGLPKKAHDSLMASLPEVKQDCSNLAELPNLEFHLNGHKLELPPSIWVHKMTPRMVSEQLETQVSTPSCWPAFTTIEKETQLGPLWILGMPFFRKYYTIFDRSGPAIHVAPSDGACYMSSGPTLVAPNAQSEEVIGNFANRAHGAGKQKSRESSIRRPEGRLPAWALPSSPAFVKL